MSPSSGVSRPAGAGGARSTTTDPGHNPASVLSVSQLARRARILIEEHLGTVLVEGEVSNFRVPGSGHWYFTLKDDKAQIRCAMFAGRNRLVRLAMADGLQVRAEGRVSLYEPRGDFQLLVDRLEAAGEGALRAAFEALKEKLAGEGLFDEDRKRPLPDYPRHLTIISSPSGAALKDVLHVIERRFPGLAVTLIPSAVQGEAAEGDLVRALEHASRLSTEVVLLTRGGGSLEDLWAFNLESVARAVAGCAHPVVSAVGHQTDFTITDFVADVRAPTPSAAAELITPTREDLGQAFAERLARLARHMSQEIRYHRQAVLGLDRRLVHPATRMAQMAQQVDELEARMGRAWSSAAVERRAALAGAVRSLTFLDPARTIHQRRRFLGFQATRLQERMSHLLNQHSLSLSAGARALSAVSPLATLERGYAVLTREATGGETGAPVISVVGVASGDKMRALLADGSLGVAVTAVSNEPPLAGPVEEMENK